MRIVEVPVLIKIRKEGEYTFQEFVFMTKKSNFKYLRDNRYSIHRKLMDRISHYSLSNREEFIMMDLLYLNDRLVLKHKSIKKVEEAGDSVYFIVSDYIPDSNGCDFCKYKIEKNNYLLCSFQDNKPYSKSLIKCRWFLQKD